MLHDAFKIDVSGSAVAVARVDGLLHPEHGPARSPRQVKQRPAGDCGDDENRGEVAQYESKHRYYPLTPRGTRPAWVSAAKADWRRPCREAK
jgi:hypothetical protein